MVSDGPDQLGIYPERKPVKIKHGTPNAYTNHKCRCDSCRAAHARRQRNYRKRLYEDGHKFVRGYLHRAERTPDDTDN